MFKNWKNEKMEMQIKSNHKQRVHVAFVGNSARKQNNPLQPK